MQRAFALDQIISAAILRVLSLSAGTAALVAAMSALSSKWKKYQYGSYGE